MKYSTLKIGVLLALGCSGAALAHTQSGTVGVAANGTPATDVYTVACPAGTARMSISVIDQGAANAGAVVSAQLAKGNLMSTLSIDAVDNDAVRSPTYILSAGAGTYRVSINKSVSATAGVETYSADFHCETSTGGHVAGQPDPTVTQNQ